MPADNQAQDADPPAYRTPRCGCCRQRVVFVGGPNKTGRGGGASIASQGRLVWYCRCPELRAAGVCFFCSKCSDHCQCSRTIFVEA